MDTRNRRMGPWDSLTSIADDITSLENINVKAIWFESIASGTSGTFSPPTGGTIVLNEWADGVDVLVSGEDAGLPNFDSIFDTEGVTLSATLDASGNWTLSGVPVDGYPVSLIYVYRSKFTNFDYTKSLEAAQVEGPGAIRYLGQLQNELTGFSDEARDLCTFSIADTTGVATVSPTGTQFSVWVQGQEFIITGPVTTTISKAEGVHIVYFDETGSLTSAQAGFPAKIETGAFVFYTYWDADTDTSLDEGEERHGLAMSGTTHRYLHETVGAVFSSGYQIDDVVADSTGNADTDAYFSISNGEIFDEDLTNDSTDSGQVLTLPAQIPVWYQDGAAGTWRKDTADNFPVKTFVGGSSLLAYNLDTAGTWSQAEITNGRYVLCHIYATNSINEPVIAVQGQTEYLNIVAAREGAVTEITTLKTAGLPVLEFVPLYSLIYQTSTTYSNTIQARIRTTDTGDDYIDWRFQQLHAASSTGTVSGPVSSTDNAITRWDGTAGNTLQDSGVVVDDTNFIQFPDATGIKDASGNTALVINDTGVLDIYSSGVKVVSTYTAANVSGIQVIPLNQEVGGAYILYNDSTNVASFHTANYTLLHGDNDTGVVGLAYQSSDVLLTTAAGVDIYDASGTDPVVYFRSSAAANLASFIVSSNDFYLSYGDGGAGADVFTLRNWDGVGAYETNITATGGAGVKLYHNGLTVFETEATGICLGDGTVSGTRLYHSNDDFIIRNQDPDGRLLIQARNAGDTAYNALFDGDPDGPVLLYYNSFKVFETNGSGINVYDASGDDPAIYFYSSTSTEEANLLCDTGNFLIRAGRQFTGKNFKVQIWDGAAYDNCIIAYQGTSVDLYYNDLISFKTTASGIDVYDTSGDDAVIGIYNSSSTRQAYISTVDATTLYVAGDIDSMNVALYSTNSSSAGRFVYLDPNTGFLPGADSLYALGVAGTCWSECHVDGGVTTCSDSKYKSDRQQEALGLSFILDLVPVAYKYRKDGKRPKNHDRVYHGFFADEIEAVLRDHGHQYEDFAGVVEDYDEDGDRWLGLKYNQFISPIVKAIQELDASNKDIETSIEDIETSIVDHLDRIGSVEVLLEERTSDITRLNKESIDNAQAVIDLDLSTTRQAETDRGRAYEDVELLRAELRAEMNAITEDLNRKIAEHQDEIETLKFASS